MTCVRFFPFITQLYQNVRINFSKTSENIFYEAKYLHNLSFIPSARRSCRTCILKYVQAVGHVG